MKYLLIEHTDNGDPARLTICDTPETREKLTREAISSEPSDSDQDIENLRERGITHFEGDPPLAWLTVSEIRGRVGHGARTQIAEEIVTAAGAQTESSETITCSAWVGGTVCNGVMKRGVAIPPAIQCSDEGLCSYAHWSAVTPRVSVWKCEKCGHSFVPPAPEVSERAPKNSCRRALAPVTGSANLASGEDGWSKMKAALKLQATIELQCCEMSDEEVSAKLASLAEWQEAVRKSHPADRRSLLADILSLEALEAAGSGEDSPNESRSETGSAREASTGSALTRLRLFSASHGSETANRALADYLRSRRRAVESSVAAEALAGNEFKLACEKTALAEITALECWLGAGGLSPVALR